MTFVLITLCVYAHTDLTATFFICLMRWIYKGIPPIWRNAKIQPQILIRRINAQGHCRLTWTCIDTHIHMHTCTTPLAAWREVKATHSTITHYKTQFMMALVFTLQSSRNTNICYSIRSLEFCEAMMLACRIKKNTHCKIQNDLTDQIRYKTYKPIPHTQVERYDFSCTQVDCLGVELRPNKVKGGGWNVQPYSLNNQA